MRMKSKKNCTAGCKTGGHKTWGECLRSKGLQISPAVNDEYGKRQTALDSELDGYEKAVKQGIQPASTTKAAVNEAVKASDAMGIAYQA